MNVALMDSLVDRINQHVFERNLLGPVFLTVHPARLTRLCLEASKLAVTALDNAGQGQMPEFSISGLSFRPTLIYRGVHLFSKQEQGTNWWCFIGPEQQATFAAYMVGSITEAGLSQTVRYVRYSMAWPTETAGSK